LGLSLVSPPSPTPCFPSRFPSTAAPLAVVIALLLPRALFRFRHLLCRHLRSQPYWTHAHYAPSPVSHTPTRT
jgi:hypothetical protein